MKTMPGGFDRLYLLAGATPCNCPSSGNPLWDFPILPQPATMKRAARDIGMDRFFIFIILKGNGQKYSVDDIFITILKFIF
jgi:hypothetical protein